MIEQPSDLEKKVDQSGGPVLIGAFLLMFFTPVIMGFAVTLDNIYPPDYTFVGKYDRLMSAHRFAPLKAIWKHDEDLHKEYLKAQEKKNEQK